MFKITGKQKFGAVWGKPTNGEEVVKPLVIFNRGEGFTDDPAAARTLKEMGYTVEGEIPEVDPLTKMKVDELKAYAAENGIDLGEAAKKAEIIAVIHKAEDQSEE